MEQYFPNGVLHYILGGLCIGAGIGGIYLLTGRIAGVSSYLTAIHSWWNKSAFFQQGWIRDDRSWKTLLIIGLIAGAAIYTISFAVPFQTDVQWWRLLIGGVFVGLGTRTARGCTSGHGICGMSAAALPSLVSTLIFMGVAILTANIVLHLGVRP